MIRLVYLVTDPITADCFLRGHLAYLRTEGFDVHLVSAPGPLLERVGEATGVTTHGVPFEREIRPWADLRTLLRLIRLLRRLAPDIVNAGTPKAGLLGLLAARWVAVRHRVYLIRGLRLETAQGFKRWLLKTAERQAARAATRIVCVSDSLRRLYAELGLAGREETEVLLHGSSNGVSMERFASARQAAARSSGRQALGLLPDAPVIGFVGRLTRDKGIAGLVCAFVDVVRPVLPDARLVLIGDFETGDAIPADTRRQIDSEPAIVVRPFERQVSSQYAAFDVVAFPSYREGFPNVPLEAAACVLPVVGYRATGTIDAVVDGVTGTLVDIEDSDALGRALVAYLLDPELRRAHGTAGFERVARDFRPADIWQAWRNAYRELLGEGA